MRLVNASVMGVCAALLMLGLSVGMCQAETVALDISNPGFDADTMPPEGYIITAPWGWTGSGGIFGCELGSAGLPAISGANRGFIGNSDYPNGGLGQLLKADGSALRVQSGGAIEINLSQGHRSDYQSGDTQQFEVQIWRDAIGTGTLAYTTGDLGNVTAGTWASRSVSYLTTADDVGKDLYVSMWAPAMVQVCLENVSGSYSAVPEPGTSVLLITSMFGLLAYVWRKRK